MPPTLRALTTTIHDLLHNPKYTLYLIPPLLLLDLILSILIILKVPYTEIDWAAYTQQISQYRAGERDYSKIYGGTGPLVYGAGHVYIYDLLYVLTDEGRDVRRAQWLFMGVYLATVGMVGWCYAKAKAPPFLLAPLILSKRLHSIFLLRLFNDGPTALLLFSSTLCYQYHLFTPASLLYSLGLATKLPLLLAAPAILLLLAQTLGLGSGAFFKNVGMMLQLQVLLGYPFWKENAAAYWGRAFEFGRAFFWKWTVNWRFVPEDVFLSQEFALGLLAAHAAILAVFVLTRWLRPSGLPPWRLALTVFKPLPARLQRTVRRNVSEDFVLTAVLSAMVIGLLCARSLHYQFYVYVAWATPWLLWKGGWPWWGVYGVWAAQEWAWNVYPSTRLSSGW